MKFDVIELDPPWLFETWSAKGNVISENHYDLMTLDDLKALPINDVTADDCAMFLWATNPMFLKAVEVGEAWGFRYITVAFQWVKRAKREDTFHFGMGHWSRANTEPCLLLTKGKPKRRYADVSQIICDETPDAFLYDHWQTISMIEPVMTHSVKPHKVYNAIQRLTMGTHYLRLFARDKLDGWTSLGNAVTGNPIQEDLERLING